jgi:hypothetical protein
VHRDLEPANIKVTTDESRVVVHPGASFSFDAPQPQFNDTYGNDFGGRSFDLAPDRRFLMLKGKANTSDSIEIITTGAKS